MTIRIVCPACGHERREPIEAASRILSCPACRIRYRLNLGERTPEQFRALGDMPVVARAVESRSQEAPPAARPAQAPVAESGPRATTPQRPIDAWLNGLGGSPPAQTEKPPMTQPANAPRQPAGKPTARGSSANRSHLITVSALLVIASTFGLAWAYMTFGVGEGEGNIETTTGELDRGRSIALGGLQGAFRAPEPATPSKEANGPVGAGRSIVAAGLQGASDAAKPESAPSSPPQAVPPPANLSGSPRTVARSAPGIESPEPEPFNPPSAPPDPAPEEVAEAGEPSAPAPTDDAAALADTAKAATHAAPDPSPTLRLSTADIVERCEPSIALIRGTSSTGTGFMIGPKLLATAAHVIEDEPISALEIRFPSAPEGRRGPLRASLLYEDNARDLAFLAVDSPLPALPVASKYEYRKGDDVTVIGNPGLGDGVVLENAITRGVMSTKATLDGQPFYQLSIAINPGNSGGPVFDPGGRVIGVANLKMTKQEALAFCVPVEDVRAGLDKLAKQTPRQLAQLRVKHRLGASFQGQAMLGALYGFGLELQFAVRVVRDDKELPEQTRALDEALSKLSRTAYAPIAAEARQARNDPAFPGETRRKLGELSDAVKQLKDAYQSRRGQVPLDEIRNLKARHRQLVESLKSDLKAEIPEGLVAVMEDHIQAGAAPNLAVGGFGSPMPGESLHRWMMERHRSMMRPPGIPSSPLMPGSRFRRRFP